jgi:hypothetical protein
MHGEPATYVRALTSQFDTGFHVGLERAPAVRKLYHIGLKSAVRKLEAYSMRTIRDLKLIYGVLSVPIYSPACSVSLDDYV